MKLEELKTTDLFNGLAERILPEDAAETLRSF